MLIVCLLLGVVLLAYGVLRYMKKHRNSSSNRWVMGKKTVQTKWLKEGQANIKQWLMGDSVLFLALVDFIKKWFHKNSRDSREEIFTTTVDQNIEEPVLPVINKKPKYLILKLVAMPPRQFYEGYELYQAILGAELKLSAGGAFARFNTSGEELFKLVPATASGVFQNGTWGKFRCRGLIFYMSYPVEAKDLEVLREMWEAACFLVDILGGEILDEKDEVFNLALFQNV